MNGTDPTAPDVEGARRRYPDWTFTRQGRVWLARRNDGSAQLEGLSLESLEGLVRRAERARAGERARDQDGRPGTTPPGGEQD